MKLIIREYLASLKERDELDAILPDLLSEIGLTVYSRPGRGTRQDGVDVAATGCINGVDEKVYLLSIKSGDLTRNSWDGDALQSLRPSLNEIIDSYIPNRLPPEHQGKPIVICLCFGGDIREQVRPSVKGFIEKSSGDGIEFEEWNGDKLAELIMSSFLREELLPTSSRSMLRKALALIDEPDISYKHYSQLINTLTKLHTGKDKEIVTVIRQLNICLWILFAWCREAKNIESAYLSGELTLLHAWNISKPFIDKKTKTAKAVCATLGSIQYVYQMICTEYLESNIFPHADKLHAISNAVHPACKVDVNLKLFDVLGRIAMHGIWSHWQLHAQGDLEPTIQKFLNIEIRKSSVAIKQLISNNPILFSPYKDEQAIDIFLAIWFLALEPKNNSDIHAWLFELIERVRFSFETHKGYPCNLRSYNELIEHPLENTSEYQEEVTAGSILYPIVAIFAALLGFDDIYNVIQSFKEKSLKHCNFQVWYPDETSEEFFYINTSGHGAVLSNVFIEKSKEKLLEQVISECDETTHFDEMSAIKYNVWPIIFLASRHHRMPVPIHFLRQPNGSENENPEKV